MIFFKEKKVKIVYIVQYKAGYSKVKDMIETMIKDSKIEIYVLAFPSDINEYSINDYMYWKDKFGSCTIDAKVGDKWFDLEKLSPDYVFFQRPYNIYLPPEFHSKEIAKYSKTCYITYGYNLCKHTDNAAFNLDFFESLDIFFAENEYERDYVSNKIFLNDKSKKAVMFGYPYLDHLKQQVKSNNSMFGRNYYNVLWTPRWTTDNELCGTSFLEYKNKMVELVKKNKDIQLVFRPHPLMFNNFIENKIMKKMKYINI